MLKPLLKGGSAECLHILADSYHFVNTFLLFSLIFFSTTKCSASHFTLPTRCAFPHPCPFVLFVTIATNGTPIVKSTPPTGSTFSTITPTEMRSPNNAIPTMIPVNADTVVTLCPGAFGQSTPPIVRTDHKSPPSNIRSLNDQTAATTLSIR